MENTTKFEIIFVLVNQGFAETVMDAARSCGARGGTIIHARGTANEEIEKNYGIVITPDKELVFILVETSIKQAIMEAVFKAAGIETPGMGIIFSMPANNVVGLTYKDKTTPQNLNNANNQNNK